MEKRRTTLDRKRISSDYIKGRQNFKQVLKGYQAAKIPIWKSAWFYGPVGLATIAATITFTSLIGNKESNDKITTQETKIASLDGSDQTELDSKNTNEENVLLAEAEEFSDPEVNEDPVQLPRSNENPIVLDPVQEQNENRPNPPVQLVSNDDPLDETAPVRKVQTMPEIGGIFSGQIFVETLCASDGIKCNDGSRVMSYAIQYHNGIEDVIENFNGARISSYLCDKLRRFNLNQPIFVTRIIVVTPDGTKKMVPSMSITPTY